MSCNNMLRFSNEEPTERFPDPASPEENEYKDALHSAMVGVECWRNESEETMREEKKRDALALIRAAETTVRNLSKSTLALNGLETLRAELEGREPKIVDGAATAERDHFYEMD